MERGLGRAGSQGTASRFNVCVCGAKEWGGGRMAEALAVTATRQHASSHCGRQERQPAGDRVRAAGTPHRAPRTAQRTAQGTAHSAPMLAYAHARLVTWLGYALPPLLAASSSATAGATREAKSASSLASRLEKAQARSARVSMRMVGATCVRHSTV